MHREIPPRSCKRKLLQATFLSLVTLFIVSSCNPDKGPEAIIINPLNVVEGGVFLSDFTDDITYIPLDNEIMFQHPNKIETTDNHFVIKAFPGGILTYDREGNFLNKIGNQGRGPGEYFTGLHFSLDRENKLVYIYDFSKIIIYNFNGEFIKEFSIAKFESGFSEIKYFSGKLFLAEEIHQGHAKYNWLVIDTLGDLEFYKKNSIPSFNSRTGNSAGFFADDKYLYYWNSLNDTIFQIHDSIYQPIMYFAQGNFRKPHQEIPLEEFGDYFEPHSIINSKNHLFIAYDYQKKIINSVINKKNGELILIGSSESMSFFDLPGIINNIDNGPDFPTMYYYKEEDKEYLIGWIHAYKLKTHVESESFKTSTPIYPEKKKQLEELAASLGENDNPVLMLVKLK